MKEALYTLVLQNFSSSTTTRAFLERRRGATRATDGCHRSRPRDERRDYHRADKSDRDRGRRLERTEAGIDRESFPFAKASGVAKAARVFHRFPRVARRPFGSSVSFEVVARCDREVFRGFSFVFRHGAIRRRFVPPFELLDVTRDIGGRGKIEPFRGVRVGGDEITDRHERVVFHARLLEELLLERGELRVTNNTWV